MYPSLPAVVRRTFLLLAGLSITVLTLTASPPCPAAAAPQVPPAGQIGSEQTLPADPDVVTGTLPNGLRYFVRVNQRPEDRAELRLVVNAGSVLEDEDQRGLAHFLEHMAFNGTEHFPKQELVDYLESLGTRFGPDINASTSFDETIYMLTLPTDEEGILATGFQVLEDWAHGQTFDPEEIEKERGVIVEEWRLGRGARARIMDRQFPVLFHGSRYAERLPIGEIEVIESFEHESLKRFYRTWYRPDLMAVVAVGDFEPQEVLDLIQQHFGGLEGPVGAPERPFFEVPDHAEALFAVDTDPELTSSSVSIYFKQPLRELGTAGGYRQGIVERLYNSMLNQRLFERTQEADPPFLFASSSQGLFIRSREVYVLSAGVQEGEMIRGLQELLTEAERLDRHGFTATELERAKTSVLRSMERSFDEREKTRSGRYAAEYVRAFLYGEPIPGIDYEYRLYQRFLPEITLEEVNRLARTWITEENRVVLASVPEKEGLTPPAEEELQQVFTEVETAEIAPYVDTVTDDVLMARVPEPGSVISEKQFDEVGITEWTLSNGAAVVLKPTDFQEDQILMNAFSPGGTSLVPTEELQAVQSAAGIISLSGIADLSLVDLRKQLTGKVASVSPGISGLEESLSGNASVKDLETLFQLTHLYFTSPRADSTAFLSMQTQLRNLLQNRGASPTSAFSDTLQAVLTQRHPRTPLPSMSMVDAMDMQESLSFYRERFADAGDFTFVFVGSLDLNLMRPLVERYLASLPGTGVEEQWRDVGPHPPRGVVTRKVYKGLEPQSITALVFSGPYTWKRSENHALSSMIDLLQIRLRERVREDLGGTYGVSVGGGPEWRPSEEYAVTIQFGGEPERMEELSGVVFEELVRLKEEAPTSEEVQKIKETQRRERETNLEENSYWLGQIAARYRRGEEPSGILGYEEIIEALTAERIREAARRYLDMENYIQVTLYPETGGA
ncbi:MAG: insulinase family protein [bacterium]